MNAPQADLLAERLLAEVTEEISPLDTMLEGDADREHYFSVGRSAIRCIRFAMSGAQKNCCDRILDFGCGFGRVLRVLRAAFPYAVLTACDLSHEAVRFCAKTFAAEPLFSNVAPDAIVAGTFDLIWCGTLLTNLSGRTICGWLEWFRSHLAPSGLLVFTMHGPYVAQRLRHREFSYGIESSQIPDMLQEYEATGFAYRAYPQTVLDEIGLEDYGISISKPSWVCCQIEHLRGFRLVTYNERAWDDHQDSFGCVLES